MMQKARFLRWACVVLAVAVWFVLPTGTQAEDPYEIDGLLTLTGAATFLGHGNLQGIAAAEAVVNRTGGINGRPVKFVIQDDQTNPQITVQLATAIIAKHKPELLVAALSAGCNAVDPLIREGPVVYCLSPSVHPPKGSFMFALDPVDTDQYAVVMRYFRQRGLTRFALIVSSDASGQDAERSLDETFALPENKGIAIVDREHFGTTDIGVAAQMARVKASNAQLLLAFATGTPFGTVLRDALQSGLGLPILTGAGNMTYAQMTQYAQIMPTELYFPGFACVVPDQVTDRRLKAAVQTYDQALLEQGVRPEYVQSTSYDPALIFVDALRKLGTNATAAQVRDYIANLHDFPASTGIYDFRAHPQRGLGQDAVIVTRWDRTKGTWVAVSKPAGAPL